MLAGLVVMLLVAFVSLRLWIARNRRGNRNVTPAHAHLRSRWREHDQLAMDEPAGLPDDPADALAELRRRAETSSSASDLSSADSSAEHAKDHGQSAASQ